MLAGIIGTIDKPLNNRFFDNSSGQGVFLFISNIFKLAAVIGSIALVVQIVMAGFSYITANGDAKKVDAAWAKIWQSVLGLAIITFAFVIASVVGRLLGIPDILNPQIYGPQ